MKARQRPGHRDHPQHLRAGAAPLQPQQQRQAESLVQHARKRVRRIDGDRGQQRIDVALEVVLGKGAGLVAQFLPLQQPDALLAQLRQQLLVPAAILRGHKTVNFGGQHGQRFGGAQAVVARLAGAVLNALHQPGLAHFHVFVQIRGR
jgi:hypothetical protein